MLMTTITRICGVTGLMLTHARRALQKATTSNENSMFQGLSIMQNCPNQHRIRLYYHHNEDSHQHVSSIIAVHILIIVILNNIP